MKHILASRHRRVLEEFAAQNVLVALDYDGTLAPLVPDPRRAAMRRKTRRLLARLAWERPCVVIAGRPASDMRARLAGVPLLRVVGNDGTDLADDAERFAPQVRAWRETLEPLLARHPGVVYEDKGVSLSVHYRRCRAKAEVVSVVEGALDRLRGARLARGHHVLNLLPVEAPDKAGALRALQRQLACEATVYLGDDETDEGVFAHCAAAGDLAIRVGFSASSRAEYYVRDQSEVDAVIRALAAARDRAEVDAD